MEYQNKLQQEIVEQLSKDVRFYYHGYTGTFFFRTIGEVDKEDSFSGDFLELNKRQSDKSLAKVRFYIHTDRFETKECHFKIEMYLNSYCDWDTFFEGWVESIEEFNLILKSVGL
jgi:hypothetical protein